MSDHDRKPSPTRHRSCVCLRQFRHKAALYQLCKALELRISPRSITHILERERQIAQVPRLAVAIPQPRENPEHLDMPLHSNEIEPPHEFSVVATTGPALRSDQVAIADHPLFDALARPADVAILEYGHEVVPDWPAQGILEINHARIGLGGDHEIARVEIAMHEHRRLHERFGDQKLESVSHNLVLSIAECQFQVPFGEPFRHQCHLAREHLSVLGRELASRIPAARLNLGQGVQGVAVKPFGLVASLEALQILNDAKVLEQEQAKNNN